MAQGDEFKYWNVCSSKDVMSSNIPVTPQNCCCVCSDHIYASVLRRLTSCNKTYANHFQDSGLVGHSGGGHQATVWIVI